jgi:hypothetical protein
MKTLAEQFPDATKHNRKAEKRKKVKRVERKDQPKGFWSTFFRDFGLFCLLVIIGFAALIGMACGENV